MSASEKKIRNIILPSLKDSLFQLSDALEEKGMSALKRNTEKHDNSNISRTNGDIEKNKFNDFRNSLSLFKAIVRKIHATSKMQEAGNSNSLDILSILRILKDNNIYDAGWTRVKVLADAINVHDQVSQDADNALSIFKAFESNKINLPNEIRLLLYGFSKYKVSTLFTLNDYMLGDIGVDMSSNHPLSIGGNILFEIKYNREEAYTPNRDHIFQLYENLKRVDEQLKNNYSHTALISYSALDSNQFETVTFKFNQFVKELNIPASFYQRMTLIPATAIEPSNVETGLKGFHEKLSSSIFNYDFVSVETIKNNHEILPRYFSTHNTRIDVTITPQNTQFWRFGFSLSDQKEFHIDRSTDDRHANQDTIDIHICVGNRPNDNWQDGNQLTLTNYKATIINGQLESYLDYKQEPVLLRLAFKGGNVSATIIVAGKNLGTQSFQCNKKFAHFMAWCDFKEYHLNTQFNYQRITLK